MHEVKQGCVIRDRTNTEFLVVKGLRPDFTGKDAYGLVNLKDYTYNDLGLSEESLKDILNKAGFKIICT